MKTITTYIYRNRNFTIVKHDDHYCGIEDKYIDENGCLKEKLDGRNLFPSTELDGCLNHIKNQCDLDHYTANGMTRAQAFAKVFNLPVEALETSGLF